MKVSFWNRLTSSVQVRALAASCLWWLLEISIIHVLQWSTRAEGRQGITCPGFSNSVWVNRLNCKQDMKALTHKPEGLSTFIIQRCTDIEV